jgi:NarL family two-component system sensor histidine kinase LiaS
MRRYIHQRAGAGEMTRDGAEQVADAVRAATVAERHRLARELHDSVTQTLMSLHFAAEAVANRWDTEPTQAREVLEIVRHLATCATTELRAVLLNLNDAVLEQKGLVAALEAYSAVVRQCSGLQVGVCVDGEAGSGARGWPYGLGARLPQAHEEALYRLGQEALANVVKHARATRATVTLVCQRTEWTVCLSVEDDGVGFGAPARAFSYGLAGMRERVGALGGRLYLDNRPAGGARVVAELPLPDDLDCRGWYGKDGGLQQPMGPQITSWG